MGDFGRCRVRVLGVGVGSHLNVVEEGAVGRVTGGAIGCDSGTDCYNPSQEVWVDGGGGCGRERVGEFVVIKVKAFFRGKRVGGGDEDKDGAVGVDDGLVEAKLGGSDKFCLSAPGNSCWSSGVVFALRGEAVEFSETRRIGVCFFHDSEGDFVECVGAEGDEGVSIEAVGADSDGVDGALRVTPGVDAVEHGEGPFGGDSDETEVRVVNCGRGEGVWGHGEVAEVVQLGSGSSGAGTREVREVGKIEVGGRRASCSELFVGRGEGNSRHGA